MIANLVVSMPYVNTTICKRRPVVEHVFGLTDIHVTCSFVEIGLFPFSENVRFFQFGVCVHALQKNWSLTPSNKTTTIIIIDDAGEREWRWEAEERRKLRRGERESERETHQFDR